MQFGILIFINIILWALFYLVISLKLERSASEFREKRLRREIDGVIREFNETADRNISILENRIAIMKKLLARTGTLKSVEFNLGDEAGTDGIKTDSAGQDALFSGNIFDPHPDGRNVKSEPARRYMQAGAMSDLSNGYSGSPRTLKDYFKLLMRETRHRITDYLERTEARLNKHQDAARRKQEAPRQESGNRTSREITTVEEGIIASEKTSENLIRRDFKDLHAMAIEDSESTDDHRLSVSELSDMFESAEDKYALISDLHRQGYDTELLSRCSGISHGEISLVLNLNKP